MLLLEWNEVEVGPDDMRSPVTNEHAHIRRVYRQQHTQHVRVCLLTPKFTSDRFADAMDLLLRWKQSPECEHFYRALAAVGIDYYNLNTQIYSIRGYDTQLKTELRIADKLEADIRAGILHDSLGAVSVK